MYWRDDSMSHEQQARQRREIERALTRLFAEEDEVLRATIAATRQAGISTEQIAPMQGKLLHMLALMIGARKILEIGTLGGYSSIWLARALPSGGRLITVEVNSRHAEVARANIARASVSDLVEVRAGKAALVVLPHLESEAPFDLVFIDADKASYPAYLEWALRFTRPGSIIVADNCIWEGEGIGVGEIKERDEATAGIIAYNERVRRESRLVSLALAIDDDYTDGFAISLVREER